MYAPVRVSGPRASTSESQRGSTASDDECSHLQPQPQQEGRDSSSSSGWLSRWKETCCSCRVCKQCLYLLWKWCCCCFARRASSSSSNTSLAGNTTIWKKAKSKKKRRGGGGEDEDTHILQQPGTDGESSVEDEVAGPRHGSTGSISIGSSGFSGMSQGRPSGVGLGMAGLGSELQLDARRRASSLTNRKESTATTQFLIDYRSIDYWSGSINSLRSPGDILVQQPQPGAAAAGGRRDTIGAGIAAQGSQQLLLLKPDMYNESPTSAGPPSTAGNGGMGADYSLGSIHFFLHYDISTKTLSVKIMEAHGLPRPIVHDSAKQDQSHSNPYVKICLLPNQKDSRQTTLRKKTQNPQFNEQFTFELTLHELERRTLSLIVKDFDKYSRHRVVGQVLLPFHHHNHATGAGGAGGGHSPGGSNANSPGASSGASQASSAAVIPSEELMSRMLSSGIELWRHLERVHSSTIQEDLGELLFSLCYLPGAGRLNIDILRAKQLLPTDLVGGGAPYVRVTVLINNRAVKTKKTTYKKYTLDPVFNESLSFDINSVQLAETSLVMTVLDFNGGVVKDNFIGRIVLGKESSGSHEVNHWKNMIQSQRTPVAQWHSLKSQTFCDELCSASRIISSSK